MRHPKQIQIKSRQHDVRWLEQNKFLVVSGDSGYAYLVTVRENGATCSCHWGQTQAALDGRSGCSHVVAVMNHLAIQGQRSVSVWSSINAAERQHRPILNIGNGLLLTTRKIGT